MSPQQKREAKRVYSEAFENLKRYGVPHTYTPRQLAGLYAVASICYHADNHGKQLIENELFDRLCKWLSDHYDDCVAQGADKLDREQLDCCSGNDTRIFVKPYHEIAEVFVGHACQCRRCREERSEPTPRRRTRPDSLPDRLPEQSRWESAPKPALGSQTKRRQKGTKLRAKDRYRKPSPNA